MKITYPHKIDMFVLILNLFFLLELKPKKTLSPNIKGFVSNSIKGSGSNISIFNFGSKPRC